MSRVVWLAPDVIPVVSAGIEIKSIAVSVAPVRSAGVDRKERAARERAEQERAARERAEQERAARETAEQERAARERAEQERAAREKAEQERAARERAEQERAARESAEQERVARERAEQERVAREKAQRERLAREKAEQERLAREKAEFERLVREQALQEQGMPTPGSSPESVNTEADAPAPPQSVEDARQRLQAVVAWLDGRGAQVAARSQAVWGSRRLVEHLPGIPIPRAWEELPDPMGRDVEAEALVSLPPEVETAADAVMARYDMTVGAMKLITTKPDKGGAIWRIETDRGPRSLKLLHRQASRSLFSVGAQEYLVAQGARVPALVPTRSGEICVETDGKLWIVTDWVEPLEPATKVDLEGAAALCYGLGEFHRKSQGYVPPPGAYNATRLHRWPKAYRKILTKMSWFREVARAYFEMPAATTVVALVDMFEQQARDAIARLDASPYGNLVARGEQAWGLVHQDYGWSNGQIGPGGAIWIIDLDGVAFDLPIRDLRKLITSTMDDMGTWDLTWMRGMIDAYNQANPIDPDLMQVLLIDMALPNEFYKHVKEMVMDPASFLNDQLDALLHRLVQVDVTKWQALHELGLQPVPSGGRPGR